MGIWGLKRFFGIYLIVVALDYINLITNFTIKIKKYMKDIELVKTLATIISRSSKDKFDELVNMYTQSILNLTPVYNDKANDKGVDFYLMKGQKIQYDIAIQATTQQTNIESKIRKDILKIHSTNISNKTSIKQYYYFKTKKAKKEDDQNAVLYQNLALEILNEYNISITIFDPHIIATNLISNKLFNKIKSIYKDFIPNYTNEFLFNDKEFLILNYFDYTFEENTTDFNVEICQDAILSLFNSENKCIDFDLVRIIENIKTKTFFEFSNKIFNNAISKLQTNKYIKKTQEDKLEITEKGLYLIELKINKIELALNEDNTKINDILIQHNQKINWDTDCTKQYVLLKAKLFVYEKLSEFKKYGAKIHQNKYFENFVNSESNLNDFLKSKLNKLTLNEQNILLDSINTALETSSFYNHIIKSALSIGLETTNPINNCWKIKVNDWESVDFYIDTNILIHIVLKYVFQITPDWDRYSKYINDRIYKLMFRLSEIKVRQLYVSELYIYELASNLWKGYREFEILNENKLYFEEIESNNIFYKSLSSDKNILFFVKENIITASLLNNKNYTYKDIIYKIKNNILSIITNGFSLGDLEIKIKVMHLDIINEDDIYNENEFFKKEIPENRSREEIQIKNDVIMKLNLLNINNGKAALFISSDKIAIRYFNNEVNEKQILAFHPYSLLDLTRKIDDISIEEADQIILSGRGYDTYKTSNSNFILDDVFNYISSIIKNEIAAMDRISLTRRMLNSLKNDNDFSISHYIRDDQNKDLLQLKIKEFLVQNNLDFNSDESIEIDGEESEDF